MEDVKNNKKSLKFVWGGVFFSCFLLFFPFGWAFFLSTPMKNSFFIPLLSLALLVFFLTRWTISKNVAYAWLLILGMIIGTVVIALVTFPKLNQFYQTRYNEGYYLGFKELSNYIFNHVTDKKNKKKTTMYKITPSLSLRAIEVNNVKTFDVIDLSQPVLKDAVKIKD